MALVETNEGEFVTIERLNPPNPAAPWDIVADKFTAASEKADQMLTILIGADGKGGALGQLQSAITSAPSITITAENVDTSAALAVSGATLPVFDKESLEAFPKETFAAPALSTLPTVDTSGLDDTGKPDDITPTISWAEMPLSEDVYSDILARLLDDLQNGATGLSAAVEIAIFDRAKAKQRAENTARYTKLNNDLSSRHFSMPSGALVAALVDFNAECSRLEGDTINNIIVTQADLAQKNSQFALEKAVAIETLLRDTRAKDSDRALKFHEAGATLLVNAYAQNIQGYIAGLTAKKYKIEAMVEVLKAVIESNRAAVDIYKEQYESLKIRTEAVASHNKALTDIHVADVNAYGEGERAIGTHNQAIAELIKAKVAAADLQVRAAIAQAEQVMSGYATEMTIREKVSSDLAHIASQSVASWASSVNANASLGYSGSESVSESFAHSDSLSESHSYEHDPIA